MKKAFKIGGLAFLAIFLIFGASIGLKLWTGIREAKALAAEEISAPLLSQVPNGTWTGEVEWGVLEVEVAVTVNDGEITKLDLLKHDNGKGEAAEAIIADVLAAQSPDVDVISGATLSSRAILHAIANALNNSQ